jgi:hypothetical protein
MVKTITKEIRKAKQKEEENKTNKVNRLFGYGRMGNKVCNQKTCKSCIIIIWFTLVVKEVKYCFHESFQVGL